MSNRKNKLQKICNDIFALNPNIRFAGIVNKMGTLVAGGMRQSIKPMENEVDSSKLYLESALRSEMRKDFDKEFGKTIYSFSEREKIKIASFPLHNDHLLRVSIEKQEKSHEKIIENTLKIIRDFTAAAAAQDSS
ncbi:MAG TPA: DUF6659 family protein [Nitrososphaeraceae archaeon]|nr:DUF6659 family protein [Nitrososphaeraceae archaeon]